VFCCTTYYWRKTFLSEKLQPTTTQSLLCWGLVHTLRRNDDGITSSSFSAFPILHKSTEFLSNVIHEQAQWIPQGTENNEDQRTPGKKLEEDRSVSSTAGERWTEQHRTQLDGVKCAWFMSVFEKKFYYFQHLKVLEN